MFAESDGVTGGSPRVADFSTHVSGPTASLFLRAAGAEVVKIENPRHGDGNRSMAAAPEIDGASIYHHSINWGAKSVAVDPRSGEWPQWVAALTRWADVVIVGGRPSDVRRLGLDLATLRAANPEVVHCHVSGYGGSGPWAERAAHGQNADALAGLVDLVADDSGRPRPLPWRPVGTSMAGVIAALGVLAALYHRATRGVILSVETSMWESAVWWNWRQLTALANTGEEWGRVTDFGSRYATYATKDHRALLVAPVEEKFWRVYCEVAGLPELATVGDWSSRYDFGEQEPDGPERARLAVTVGARSLTEWVELLEPTGIPFCEVLSAADVLGAPHFSARDMLLQIDGGDGRVIRPPLRLVDDGALAFAPDTRLPGLGAHTEEMRGRLGIDP